MSIAFYLGITSTDAICLKPEFDYYKGKKKVEKNIRTKSGKLYTYKLGTYDYIKFTLDYVSAQNASIINSWWDSNAELLLFTGMQGSSRSMLLESGWTALLENGGGILLEDSPDYISGVNSVMIISKKTPLTKKRKPYFGYYKGKILLEGY